MSARYCIRCDRLVSPSEKMLGLYRRGDEEEGGEPSFQIHLECLEMHVAGMWAATSTAIAAGARQMAQEVAAGQVPNLRKIAAASKLAGAADNTATALREMQDLQKQLLDSKDDGPEAKR